MLANIGASQAPSPMTTAKKASRNRPRMTTCGSEKDRLNQSFNSSMVVSFWEGDEASEAQGPHGLDFELLADFIRGHTQHTAAESILGRCVGRIQVEPAAVAGAARVTDNHGAVGQV